jgi:hypothetical protein
VTDPTAAREARTLARFERAAAAAAADHPGEAAGWQYLATNNKFPDEEPVSGATRYVWTFAGFLADLDPALAPTGDAVVPVELVDHMAQTACYDADEADRHLVAAVAAFYRADPVGAEQVLGTRPPPP